MGTRWSKEGGASHIVLLGITLFLQRWEQRLEEVRKSELGSHGQFLNVKKNNSVYTFFWIYFHDLVNKRKFIKFYLSFYQIAEQGSESTCNYRPW